MVSRVNSVPGTRHKRRQPRLPKPGTNPGVAFVGSQQIAAGQMTAHAWPPGGKVGFPGFLGCLWLTKCLVPGTEGDILSQHFELFNALSDIESK